MRLIRAMVLCAALALSSAGLVATGISPAAAVQAPQTQLVSDNPKDNTPNVADGKVEAIAQAGTTTFLGGTFTQVSPAGGAAASRANIVAFDATTGALSTTFLPVINGEVTSLVVAPDRQSIYVGGFFTTVNGTNMRKVARINLADGSLTAGFKSAAPNGSVGDLKLSNGRLWLAGTFTTVGTTAQAVLATMNPATGALLPYMNLTFAGPRNGGSLAVAKIEIAPDGGRLVAIGNFTTINGLDRGFVGVLDLTSATNAGVAPWQTSFFGPACNTSAFDSYMRDLDIDPTGTYFVISTTGGPGGFSNSPCDETSRWELGSSATGITPTWVNYTGGDTTYAVAITGSAVYTGGHFRFQNNPFGSDSAGQGAVGRQGLTALDPVNGLPLSWNPGRDRGVGVFDLLATATGLWVGSDTDVVGGETHGKIVFFPLDGGATIPAGRTGVLPGHVFLTGSAASSGPVLYRVDAAGPALLSLDSGPDWSDDTASTSTLRTTGSSAASYPAVPKVNATVPTSTPSAIFSTERWSPSDNPAMKWAFPAPVGAQLQVRLYFANRCTCTNTVGKRVFNVALDGTTVLNRFDIVAAAGDQTGTMKAFNLTSDGTVNIDFSHAGADNPLVNGIEIVRTDVPAPPPADNLQHDYVTGTTGQTVSTQDGGGLAWSTARGAAMIDGTVYYGATDGSFTARTFDGTTFGPAVAVNTSDLLTPLADWRADIRNMTGLFFSGGRLYFTLLGDHNLYYRYFTPQSGVVGSLRFTASPSVTGIDFGTVDGMFVSGSTLYFGSSADNALRSIPWSGTAPVAGTATTISGPALDGVNWRNRAMWLYTATNLPAPAGNKPPVATASVTCTNLVCSADGSGSSDPDGTIASYAWDFGDGTTATGATATNTYATEGTSTVKLTVTDNLGATAVASRTVTVTPAAAAPINFVGATSANVNAASVAPTVPAGAVDGDSLLLFVTNNSSATLTPPAGWTLVSSRDLGAANGTTYLYSRLAGAGAVAGGKITLTLSAASKVVATIAAYHGPSATSVAAAVSAAETTSRTTHTTPAAPIASTGSWVVSYWADKSNTTTAWTAPASVISRNTSFGTGTGHVDALLADGGAPASAGTAPALTATADAAAARATMWTVVLRPSA